MTKTRLFTGLAALLAGGAGLGLAAVGPDATHTQTDPIQIDGTARAVSLACAPDFEKTMGEMTAGIGGEDSDTLLRTRAIVIDGGEASLSGSELPDGEIRTFFEEGAHPGEFTVEPGDEPALAAGTTQRYQEFGELAGMALVPCEPAGASHFLVGGSTSASASTQLVLTNVSGTPASVEVRVHTSTGTAGPSIVSSTTVDAYSSETLLMEAGVRDSRIAVEVVSRGGHISPHLLTHEVDGIRGAGIEAISAGSEPATTVVVPGANLTGDHGDVDIRVANPGTERATISISAVTTDGVEEVPGSQDVAIAPGTVLDLSMDGLRGDWSTLIVEADLPVLAGVRVDMEGDYAWLPSAIPATTGVVAVPDTDSYLTLYAETETSAVVTYYDHLGEQVDEVTATVGPIATLPSPEGTSFAVVEADDAIYAGVFASRKIGTITGIAGLALTVPPAGSSDLQLHVIN